MKFYISFLFIFLMLVAGYGQHVNSYVTDGLCYTTYTVAKSEGLYSITTKYGVSNAAIMLANGLQPNTILQEGQLLKIPLAAIIRPVCSGADCLAVYYEVQQSEDLYRIGKNHGNIKVERLKQLNHLTTESVSKGMQLLVGYLLVHGTGNKNISANITTEKPVNKVADTTASIQPANDTPIIKSQPLKAEEKTVVIANNPKPGTSKKDLTDTIPFTYSGKGFFEPQYKHGSTELLVWAAPFKSESGWTDGKFYILMDEVAAGIIVKIINPATSVFIYAKVLGPLPHVKSNDAAKLRISNAATVALGFRYETVFEVTIGY
ncbi:hypothetical protein BH10BAC3_BH10BAC3_39420 [soil metagenome]